MALNNRERIGKAFEYLVEGLYDPVDDIMTKTFGGKDWNVRWSASYAEKNKKEPQVISKDDVQTQLRAITEFGREFNEILPRSQQAYASELRETRNKWAHMGQFNSDETLRALSTIELLLKACEAPDSAADVRKLHDDLQRTVYEDRTRKVSHGKMLMVEPLQGMKPWREVIHPHGDVASGNFTASEFAADLYQVAAEGDAYKRGDAYSDPVEFFNRTYLTEGLRDLLARAIKRLEGDNSGSPVVNLQTNFGGGKTHSLLALYHLFGNVSVGELSSDVQGLAAELGVKWEPGNVRRVALVGTKLNVAKPDVKYDGTEVHTIWGELAWQLGGREAYDMIAENDKTGKNPGHLLDDLLAKYSPCLILIDEWVAYAKQLIGHDDLPAGTFDDQFVFAQTLTEAVKATPHCMLVVSIPASETGGRGNDIEVGGENGQRTLRELQNIVRREADQWRPSTRDESFEIVRRRLFEEPDAAAQERIALTARRFVDMYREHPEMYPSDVTSSDYERRLRASYPLHPELLDMLYEDWSGLETFQRTRGVLTLVSNIIHELWASNDSSPLILPGNVPLESDSVNSNLTQYLRDPWKPIIDADVSGPDSASAKIDMKLPVLGQRHLAQRIARTIFVGSAPRANSQNPGVSEQEIRLGTAIPGDNNGNFGTALNALGQHSTYFFNGNSRYGYSLQPSIAKTARDYAESLRKDPETVFNEIVRRLQTEGAASKRGKFRRVCVAPDGSDGILDVDEATLVIMHPRWSIGKGEGDRSEAKQWISDAIRRRGTAQRVNRNMVVFLVASKDRIGLVENEARSYLGWKNVIDNERSLNLTHQQIDQAKATETQYDKNLNAQIRNAYLWCVYPEQEPSSEYRLRDLRVPDTGGDSMAERTGNHLANNDMLIERYTADGVGYEIIPQIKSAFHDGVLSVGDVWKYVAQFPYMPRIIDREVFNQAVEDAESCPLDESARFALASDRNPETGEFRNLIISGVTDSAKSVQVTDSTLIVDWDVAVAAYEEAKRKAESNQDAFSADTSEENADHDSPSTKTTGVVSNDVVVESPMQKAGHDSVTKKRYYATVNLHSETLNRELAKVNEAVLDQLRMAHADISISLEIRAENAGGFDDRLMSIIDENAGTLGFENSAFEEE